MDWPLRINSARYIDKDLEVAVNGESPDNNCVKTGFRDNRHHARGQRRRLIGVRTHNEDERHTCDMRSVTTTVAHCISNTTVQQLWARSILHLIAEHPRISVDEKIWKVLIP